MAGGGGRGAAKCPFRGTNRLPVHILYLYFSVASWLFRTKNNAGCFRNVSVKLRHLTNKNQMCNRCCCCTMLEGLWHNVHRQRC